MRKVNNIKELKNLSNLRQGETIHLLSHLGVSNYGEGYFTFNSIPLFETLEDAVINYDYNDFPVNDNINNTQRIIKVTPLTRALGADMTYGSKVRFDNGVKGIVVANKNVGVEQPIFGWQRAYGKGETEIRLIVDGELPKGSKAYFLDDNGSYINLNNQLGWLERINPNKVVTPEMYGAIPSESIYDKNPVDNHKPLQDCFDSFFEVYLPNKYYTSKELFIRVNKNYTIKGYDKSYNVLIDRRSKYVDINTHGCIYTDRNDLKSVVTIASCCNFYGRIDVSLCKDFTNSALRILTSMRFKGEVIADIIGNTEEVFKKGIGGDGFLMDAENTYEEGILTNNGHMSGCKFSINAIGFKHPIRHTVIAKGINTFTNNCHITFFADYCKTGIWLEDRLDSSHFEGILQSRDSLHSEYEGRPANLINSSSSYYDVQVWDYRAKENSNKQAVIFTDNSKNITLGKQCLANQMYIANDGVDRYTNLRLNPVIHDDLRIKSVPNRRYLTLEAINTNQGRGIGFFETKEDDGKVSQSLKSFITTDKDPMDFVNALDGANWTSFDEERDDFIPKTKRSRFVRITGDLSDFKHDEYMPNPQRINGVICHSSDNSDFGFVLFSDDENGALGYRKFKKGKWSSKPVYLLNL